MLAISSVTYAPTEMMSGQTVLCEKSKWCYYRSQEENTNIQERSWRDDYPGAPTVVSAGPLLPALERNITRNKSKHV